jgi:hypothetical protein
MKTTDYIAMTADKLDTITELRPGLLDALGTDDPLTAEQEQTLLLMQVAVRDLYRWLRVDELPDDDDEGTV